MSEFALFPVEWQTLLDLMPSNVALLDSSGNILAVNAAWREFAATNGLRMPDAGVGANYLDSVSDEGRTGSIAEAADGIQRVLAEEHREFSLEYSCHSPTEKRWFLLRVVGVEGQGRVRVVVAHENISHRMQANRMLEIQHRLAQTLSVCTNLDDALSSCLEAAARSSRMDAGGVYLVDPATGALRLASSKGLADDFVKTVECFGPDSPHAAIVRCGEPRYMTEENSNTLVGRPGRLEGLRSLAVIPVLHEGKVTACLNMTSHARATIPPSARIMLESIGSQMGDVIARLQTQEELRKNEATFRSILDNMAEAIVIQDIDTGQFLDVNSAMLTMFGVTREEAMRLSVRDFSLGDHSDTETEAMAMIQRAAAGVPQLVEWRARRKNGEPFWVEVAVKKATIGGKPRVMSVLRDVSERNETEENIRRMKDQLAHVSRLSTMGEMVAGIAHEVNQPLYAIKNFATASSNFLTTPGEIDIDSLREMNARITNAAQRAADIITRMRGFARLTESERSVCRLNDIVIDSIQLVAFEARRHNVQVEVQQDESQPVVRVDRIQIQQVLVNLLQNAFEAFQEPSERTRKVKVLIESQGPLARVAVNDNGQGLLANGRNVFDPFVTSKASGMGMGLAISRTILEAHSGSIETAPNPQGGTTFHFSLPQD
ncbi:MAG: PAS domain S-box protein [Pirellulaceae bacterium]